MKNRIKSWIALGTVLCLILSFCSCMGDTALGGDSAETDSKSNGKVTVEEQKCFEYDGFSVTVKGYKDDGIFGPEFALYIENNSSEDRILGCRELIINNCMVTNLLSVTVPAGSKANDALDISSSDLKKAGIDTVGKVEAYFIVMTSALETIYSADPVTIKTSAYDSCGEVAPSETGTELFNEGGVKIGFCRISEDEILGKSATLYIENNSDKNIIVQADNFTVNDFKITEIFTSTVYAGKHAYSDITMTSDQLEQNGITNIEKLSMKFIIMKDGTFDRIATSGVVTVKI